MRIIPFGCVGENLGAIIDLGSTGSLEFDNDKRQKLTCGAERFCEKSPGRQRQTFDVLTSNT